MSGIYFHSFSAIFFLFAVLSIGFSSCSGKSDSFSIALNTQEQENGLAAVEEISGQEDLTNIALKAELPDVRLAAVRRVSDQDLLAVIASEADHIQVRHCAVEKIYIPELLAGVADQTGGRYARAIWKLSLALENVPGKHNHRLRNHIIPALGVLTDSGVVAEIGEIIDISTRWESREAMYNGDSLRRVSGESFYCSIELANQNEPIAHSWTTKFPATLSTPGFLSAEIVAADLIDPVYLQLPRNLLANIALENRFYAIRAAAVAKMTNESLLARIAKEDEHRYVRMAAVEKLTDQDHLADIALNDRIYYVRAAAAKKLTNQDLISSIALEDKNFYVRKAAVEMLTDKELQEKIAKNDEHRYVRQAALKRIEKLNRNKQNALPDD